MGYRPAPLELRERNTADLIAEREGRHKGAEVKYLCLDHDDHRPSASWNEAKGTYYCHVCKAKGNAKDLAKLLALSRNGNSNGNGNGAAPTPTLKQALEKVARTQWRVVKAYTYTDADRKPLYQVCRLAPLEGESKPFRQRRPDGRGGWVWGIKGVTRVLYYLSIVLAAVRDRVPVHIVEGEKDADNLMALGLCATTNSGGAGNWLDSYSDTLKSADVVILPDNDEAGRKHAEAVARSLQGKASSIRVIALPDLAEKGDVSDWLAAGHTRKELEKIIKGTAPWVPSADAPVDAEEEPQGTQAELLLALAQDAELFRATTGEFFATYPVDDHHETGTIRGAFKHRLTRRFFQAHEKIPSTTAVENVLRLLEAQAAAGPKQVVHTRVAAHDGKLYIDLCNDAGEVIEITAGAPHYRIINKPPVKFRYRDNAAPLPHPERGGSLNDLRPFVNVATEDDWVLLVGFLLQAACASLPNAMILALIGEQGSAKTTLGKVGRALIDPVHEAASRALPRDERDLAIATRNGHVLVFSNISHIPDWMSDALCRIASGEGFCTRRLYSDDEEIVFGGARPMILNGISDFTARGDLRDRSAHLYLQPIRDAQRRDETTLWRDFDAARPRILGAICSALSTGLRNLPSTKLDRLPRLADVAKWVTACEPALKWKPGRFIAALGVVQESTAVTALESNPVAVALQTWIEKEGTPFDRYLTATALLEALCGTHQFTETWQANKAWPQNARALREQLTRVSPDLRKVGIALQFGCKPLTRGGPRSIRIAAPPVEGMEGVVEGLQRVVAAQRSTENPLNLQGKGKFAEGVERGEGQNPTSLEDSYREGEKVETREKVETGGKIEKVGQIPSPRSPRSTAPIAPRPSKYKF